MAMYRALRGAWVVLFCCALLSWRCVADSLSVSNLLATGDLHDQQGETQAAIKAFLDADELAPNNAEILVRLAKQYCDCMHGVTKAEAKNFAGKALDCSLKAVKADPQNPKAHVCAAVCYAKNFPYLDNQTRVDYSRQIKAEAEKAIMLDPTFDLAYHMLGRWHFEVSNMNIFVKGLVRIAYGGLPKASREMAIQNFKKAVALLPNRIINHLQLARCYHTTGREDLTQTELKQCGLLIPLDKDDKDAQDIAKKVLQSGKWPQDF
jgi:tetratricopeptide (TPR) repeat protein